MAINETLKFSWGHIIAFVALIFISYVSFMGVTYLSDGNFILAGIGVVVVDLLLILFFIVPQILKSTDVKFAKRIVFERILLCLAPIFFIVAMVPYAHFWTVFKNRANIEKTFSESIETSKGMFASYEEYAENRIMAYKDSLALGELSAVRQANQVEALRVQLKSENYDNLKTTAVEWIDNTSGTTVWNVFKIGNIKQIEDAIDGWNGKLSSFSSKKMADEHENVVPFTTTDPSVKTAKSNLSKLRSMYTTIGQPTLLAIGVALLLFALLMFPYIIQRRNTKSTYRLFSNEIKATAKAREKGGKKNVKVAKNGDDIVFVEDKSSSNNGKYDSFTM